MTPKRAQAHGLAKPGAWLDNPFHEHHPVIKVGVADRAKIFAFANERSVGVKSAATREEADEWLHRYPDDAAVMPYLGRSGWNELRYGGAIADDELREAIDESYRLVVGRMPAKHRPVGWDEV